MVFIPGGSAWLRRPQWPPLGHDAHQQALLSRLGGPPLALPPTPLLAPGPSRWRWPPGRGPALPPVPAASGQTSGAWARHRPAGRVPAAARLPPRLRRRQAEFKHGMPARTSAVSARLTLATCSSAFLCSCPYWTGTGSCCSACALGSACCPPAASGACRCPRPFAASLLGNPSWGGSLKAIRHSTLTQMPTCKKNKK